MTFRDMVAAAFVGRRGLALIWGVAVLLCLAVPGPGALLAMFWIVATMALGRQRIADVGLRRPTSVERTVLLALVLAALIDVVADGLLTPLVVRYVGAMPDTHEFEGFAGNLRKLLGFLALSWVVGGLVEELVFRGFMISYGLRLFGARAARPLAVFSAAVFGLSHLYQGAAGVVLTGGIGLLLGAVFLLSRRNLLLTILVHGLIDTTSFVLGYFGISRLFD